MQLPPKVARNVRIAARRLCRVDAECYRYGVKTSSKDCVNAINNLYKADNYYRWENLLRRNHSRKFFESVFDKVEQYAHDKMDILDSFHNSEFFDWKNDPKNRADFIERQNLVSQKAMQKAQEETITTIMQSAALTEKRLKEMEKKVSEAEFRASAASGEAAEATRRANEASRRADEASITAQILRENGF